MSQTLAATIHYLAEKVATVEGIRTVYENPPDNLAVFPCGVVYAVSGTFDAAPVDVDRSIHNINIEIHIAKRDLLQSLNLSEPFIEKVPSLFLSDPTLGSTAQTYLRISYLFGRMGWGNLDTVGVKFTFEGVKLQNPQ